MSAARAKLYNYIFAERKAPTEGKYLEKLSPHTGAFLYDVPNSGLMDVVSAVQAANKAAPEWAKRSARERSEIMIKIANHIESFAFELAQLDERDIGAPLSSTQDSSISDSVLLLRYHAKLMLETQKPVQTLNGGYALRNRLNGSVSGLIQPALEPIFSLIRKLAPALAIGGPVIVKPSHLASASTLRIAEICTESGLPPGVMNVLCGTRAEAGEAILQHPGISQIAFTGCSTSAQKILQAAAEGGKRTQLSLGGRNPVLVFADADLDVAAGLAADICFNFHRVPAERGSRLFVQESIYNAFLDKFKDFGEKLTTGPLPDETARLRFLAASTQAGSEKGKTLFEPQSTPQSTPQSSGYTVLPQAYFDLTLCSTLQQEEVPGPFVSIASFKYQHDAIKQANTSPLAQAAYVIMKDDSKAARVAQKLEASRVYINARSRRILEAETYPVKQSGFGGDGPQALLDFFARPSFIYSNTEIKLGPDSAV